jgi:hypothetical protein
MRPNVMRALRLLRALIVIVAGLLSANYVIPGFTLPTEPEALVTVVPFAAALVLLSAWPFFALHRRWVEPRRRADWQRMMKAAENDWSSPHESVLWRWVLATWTLVAVWILGPVPLALFVASLAADRLGWPSTLGGPVAMSVGGLVIALLAKLVWQLSNTDGRRAALLGLGSAALSWAGLVAAADLVEGVHLGTENLKETMLTAGIAAVMFFGLPKAGVVRLSGSVEWARGMALGDYRFWASGTTVFGTWSGLAASFLGGVFMLWLATWFAPNVLPIPLRFDGFGALIAAAALVTIARVPAIILARYVGELPALYSGQCYLRVDPLTGRVDERLRGEGRKRRDTVEVPEYHPQYTSEINHLAGWGGSGITNTTRYGAAIEAGYGIWSFRRSEWEETTQSSGSYFGTFSRF